MFTKDDLKTFRKVIREEIEAEGKNIRDEINSRVISSRMSLQSDIRELSDRTKNLEVRTSSVEKIVKGTAKKLDKAIRVFDHLDVNLRKRVVKLEENTDLKLQQL